MESEELPPVGKQLRHWRTTRGLSQLALAEMAEVSTRHLSFIETGKSTPSREMVLVLASALDVPLRERNRLLLAAGFAPVYRERSFAAPEMEQLRSTIDLVLRTHDPFPAAVVDRRWDLLAANKSAQRLIAAIVDPSTLGPWMSNAMHMTFHPQGLRRAIVNWGELSAILVQRLRREALDDPGQDGVGGLLESLAQYGPLPRPDAQPSGEPRLLIPVRLRLPELELRLFTTIATLGTPIDVTAQELRIETYYPADLASEEWLRAGTEVERPRV
ncbi:MAG TPA: helix-turn-helix transcriptional regulator [Nannocystaceae bacterium]|nr:helix-turn-helix transcriptional regulator [Nannocystaceae bacterium]